MTIARRDGAAAEEGSEESGGALMDEEGSAPREGSRRPSLAEGVDGTPRDLGKYRIVAQLGEGGAATVYLAVAAGPAGVNKLLVVKVLKRQLAAEPDFLRMFIDEARLSTRLNHPNIVQMIEVGSADDRYFTVMEYLEGKPLARLIGANIPGIGLSALVHLVAEALGALHYAHELADYDGTALGVIHRDVSPQNVFVTYDGHAKLLDFGIAKMVWSNETEVGMIKGKPRYMAPEQVIGGSLDRRADIFSTGVILWEAIVGRRMWAGKADMAVLYAVTNGHIPSLSEAAPNAPPELVRIVTRALAVDRDERYPTALAFQEELETYLRRSGEVISPRVLGRTLTQYFASDRAHIKREIEAQLGALAAVSSVGEFRVVSFQERGSGGERISAVDLPSAPQLASRPLPRIGEDEITLDAAALTPEGATAPSSEFPPPATGRRWFVVLAIAVAAAAAWLVTSWTRRDLAQPPTTERPAPAATTTAVTPVIVATAPAAAPAPPASASAPAMVTVTLLASPSQSHVFLDGKPLPTNPFVGHFPKDDAMHVLRAEASGFVPRETQVTLATDGFFEATLSRRGGPPGRSPSSPSSAAEGGDVSVERPAPSSSTAPASSADANRPASKKRAVDRNDPYSE